MPVAVKPALEGVIVETGDPDRELGDWERERGHVVPPCLGKVPLERERGHVVPPCLGKVPLERERGHVVPPCLGKMPLERERGHMVPPCLGKVPVERERGHVVPPCLGKMPLERERGHMVPPCLGKMPLERERGHVVPPCLGKVTVERERGHVVPPCLGKVPLERERGHVVPPCLGKVPLERERGHVVPPCLGKVPRELVKTFPHTKRVGTYLVGKMINKGSFAKVMEGLHISTGEKVAIKVIDKRKARQDSYVLKNMKREPRIHQMVRHPNVVLLLEALETENSYYMVMELCAGGGLMERICERKRLDEREVRRYTRHILSAVEHLHRHGIVHRDLKIENFLLDEYNNIKIVDFGLSNTLKAESMLMTQCGSPAYAAPELLAHRKYGPKVDVWSVGVSMFAMLTGTLPFTVEPFNIKQLHQKMINGEISTIPSDISKAAVQFVLSLLEPEPSKRPSVRAAMEERWLNEGYAKRPLNTVSYNNRLRPEELNASVLSYMTESLGYGLSDVIHTVINNRPSAIMAAYHLLLRKLERHHKGAKAIKNESANQKSTRQSAKTQRNQSQAEDSQRNQSQAGDSQRNQSQAGDSQRSQSQAGDSQGDRRKAEPVAEQRGPSPSVDGITDDEIAITVETKEGLFPEVSACGERELVHPKCSCREGEGLRSRCKLCGSAPCGAPVTTETRDQSLSIKPPKLRPSHSDSHPGWEESAAHHRPGNDDRLEKLQTFYSDKGVSPRMHLESRAGQRFKDLLLAIEEKTHLPPHRHLGAMETVVGQTTSPLPRLRHHAGNALKEATPPRQVTWVGLTRHSGGGGGANASNPSPFLVNGSKPPAFPSNRQQALVIKSLRHSKEKRSGGGERGGGGGERVGGMVTAGNAAKRNSVQLRTPQQRKVSELNLPMLPATFHTHTHTHTHT